MNEMPIIRGQSERWPVSIYQDDGITPVNLTGYAVTLESDFADIVATVTVPSPLLGMIEIAMTPAQTLAIVYRERFRIKTVSGGGEVKYQPNSPSWLWLVPQ